MHACFLMTQIYSHVVDFHQRFEKNIAYIKKIKKIQPLKQVR